jgi:hypothetical protein
VGGRHPSGNRQPQAAVAAATSGGIEPLVISLSCTRAELGAQGGLYARLASLQFD